MTTQYADSWYFPYLVCPNCRQSIVITETEASCSVCGFARRYIEKLDLRPDYSKLSPVTLDQYNQDYVHTLESVDLTPPKETYSGPSAKRISTGFMSEISRTIQPGARVLDLGCGPRDQAVPLEHLGMNYVGVDVAGDGPDFYADAHAVPFNDLTFDCVFSYAVLEHLHSPWSVMREIERILKPGGIYIGSVSQGEPFHDSFFHMTAWGAISLFSTSPTLELKKLWATEDTLWSLGTMGRYPRVIKFLIRLIHTAHKSFPILAPRRMQWSSKEKMIDELHRSGNVCFVLSKH